MNNILPQYFGLEIEFENTRRERLHKFLESYPYFNLVRDASVETRVLSLYKTPIKYTNLKDNVIDYDGNLNSVLGGELTLSKPMSIEIFKNKDFIRNINSILCELNGEENSFRSSIHVHIDINNSVDRKIIKIYKNIIRLLNRGESLIYKLSSIFKEHRGVYNNYNYCRPITLWGPACYRVSDGNYNYYFGQLFNSQKLLQANTVEEFFYLYGDSLRFKNWKFHPVRYHGFNLFSLLRHGSLEYRTMNFTSNFTNIYAMILFFYYLTYAMINMNYREILNLKLDPIGSIYDENINNERGLLSFILDLIPNEYKTYKNRLIDLYSKSTNLKIKPGYYMSHMIDKSNDVLFGGNFEYAKPDKIDSNLIAKPTYIDIHNVNWR